jgi:guanyl-specific ribonuclease Sa
MRQAALDLDCLKLETTEDAFKVARLRGELRDSLLKDQSRFAKEAQCVAARARELSAQHSRDSAQMKSARGMPLIYSQLDGNAIYAIHRPRTSQVLVDAWPKGGPFSTPELPKTQQ